VRLAGQRVDARRGGGGRLRRGGRGGGGGGLGRGGGLGGAAKHAAPGHAKGHRRRQQGGLDSSHGYTSLLRGRALFSAKSATPHKMQKGAAAGGRGRPVAAPLSFVCLCGAGGVRQST